MRRLLLVAALAVVGHGVVACGSSGPRIAVTDAVAPVPAEPASAAVYMKIANSGDDDDRLLSITTPRSSSAMLHETSIDRDGRATMKMVGSVAVPAGTTVTLRPGGLHLMLSDPEPMTSGSNFTVHLRFEHAGDVDVKVRVVGDSSQVPE